MARLLWDDAAHVTPPDLQSLDGLRRIWFERQATQQYYPLLHTAFWIEHRLWGDSVAGYHLTNILLHALAACLLVVIVRGLWRPAAPLAGLLFALHPVCVEAVAWISEQKSTLSAVFYLASALVYCVSIGTAASRNISSRSVCLRSRCSARPSRRPCQWLCCSCFGGREGVSNGSAISPRSCPGRSLARWRDSSPRGWNERTLARRARTSTSASGSAF